MSYLTYQDRLKYLLELVEKGNLRSPDHIANTFFCSDKTARNMINTLRDQGYNIKYSRNEKRYLLKKPD